MKDNEFFIDRKHAKSYFTGASFFEDYYVEGKRHDIKGDGRFNWFIEQMYSLIDELKKEGIRTNDFVNPTNLGLKKSGNLGYFDIGFGDPREEFKTHPEEIKEEIPIDSNVLNKILSHYKIKLSNEIGNNGHFGLAYETNNGKILKITSDKTEAVNSKKIEGKELTHIANIYDVKFMNINENKYYTIILEKLNTKEDFLKYFIKLGLILMNDKNDKQIDHDIPNMFKSKYSNESEILKQFIDNGYYYGMKEAKKKNLDPLVLRILFTISAWVDKSKTNSHDYLSVPPSVIKLLKIFI